MGTGEFAKVAGCTLPSCQLDFSVGGRMQAQILPFIIKIVAKMLTIMHCYSILY